MRGKVHSAISMNKDSMMVTCPYTRETFITRKDYSCCASCGCDLGEFVDLKEEELPQGTEEVEPPWDAETVKYSSWATRDDDS